MSVIHARKAAEITLTATERSERDSLEKAKAIVKQIDEVIVSRAQDGCWDLTHFFEGTETARTRDFVVAILQEAGYDVATHGGGQRISVRWSRGA